MAGQIFVMHVPSIGSSLTGTTSQSASAGVVVSRELADGNIFPGLATVVSDTDSETIQTMHIDDMLSLTGLTGAAKADVVIGTAPMGAGGVKSASADWVTKEYATAYVIPNSISCDAQGSAVGTCTVMMYGTAPAFDSSAEALGGSPGVSKKFGLGPILINGTQFSDITSVNIDFAVQTDMLLADGDIVPKTITTLAQVSTVTFTSADETLQETVGRGLVASTSNGAVIYFRKRTNTGYASGSSHVTLTMATALITPVSTQRVAGGKVLTTYKIEPYGASGLWAYSSSAALPS